MRVLGASSVCASAVVDELRESAYHGRPCLVYSDGPDLIGIFADGQETANDLMRIVRSVVPELRAAT